MVYYFIYFYIFILLLVLSFIDLKTKIIPDKYCIMIFGMGFVSIILEKNAMSHFKGLAVMLVINMIIAITTKGLGGGDVKIFTALGFVFKTNVALEILIISFLSSGIFIIIVKIVPKICIIIERIKALKEIPFVPFITLAYFVIIINEI